MKTIKNDTVNTIIINKSKFICELIKVYNIDDIEKSLTNIKNKYKDATHYCYAYIIGNIKRFNDDGEPGGTAGMPILNVLENNDLNNILCVVIRYFGGIKLGAGGLVRAYSNSVTKALENIEIKEIKEAYEISINFKYDNVKNIDYILKNYNILKKEFNNDITYEVKIPKDEFNGVKEKLNNLISNIEIINDTYI